MRIKYCSFYTTFILTASLVFLLYFRNYHQVHKNQMIYIPDDVKLDDENAMDYKVILLYSSLFGHNIWPGLAPSELKTALEECEYYRCKITYDKEAVSTADALIFHGPDLEDARGQFSADILRNVSKQKNKAQKWIFFSHESPYFHDNFQNYSGIFDWTMSYKYTSDIFAPPAGSYELLQPSEVAGAARVNYAQQKTKLGIWLASSNCDQPRGRFLKELKRYLPITVVGKCSREGTDSITDSVVCKHGADNCTKFIKSHKFIFAFENSFCDYYVTEKYWHQGIDMGLVPVVMGARYDNLTVIPGSYIDALAYKSIRSLAKYLMFLHQNDHHYNEYFKWKLKYKHVVYNAICKTCESLYTNKERKSPYKDIWSADEDCKPFDWKINLIDKLVREATESRS